MFHRSTFIARYGPNKDNNLAAYAQRYRDEWKLQAHWEAYIRMGSVVTTTSGARNTSTSEAPTVANYDMVIFPSSVFPAWAAIPVAICIGILIRKNYNLLLISVIGVAILYFTIYVGSVMPLELPGDVFGLGANGNWIILLFVYAGIASMLPVWLLLQPRDYINGAQLVLGLFIRTILDLYTFN